MNILTYHKAYFCREVKLSYPPQPKVNENAAKAKTQDPILNICCRPIMKMLPPGTGCQGPISKSLCLFHRTGKKTCVKCNSVPVSNLCIGDFCNTVACRDYIWSYRKGKSITVLAYPCVINSCNNKSDTNKGRCEKCARDHRKKVLDKLEESPNQIRSVQCRVNKKNGTQCSKMTASWTGKCPIHISK